MSLLWPERISLHIAPDALELRREGGVAGRDLRRGCAAQGGGHHEYGKALHSYGLLGGIIPSQEGRITRNEAKGLGPRSPETRRQKTYRKGTIRPSRPAARRAIISS